MPTVVKIITNAVLVLGFTVSAMAENTNNIEINDNKETGNYEISLPGKSRLITSIPNGALRQVMVERIGGGTNSPRYFQFESEANRFIVSGWYEPSSRYIGFNKWWNETLSGWGSTGLPFPEGVDFKEIGEWETVVYDLKTQAGTQTNIRAHLKKYGTWVELHASIFKPRVSDETRLVLYDFIKSVKSTENQGAFGDGSPDEMLKDFAFLISKVRGAIRYQLERTKECLPWASLAIDSNDREAIVDFGFTPEMVVKIGEVSAKALGKQLAVVANKESFTLGAIGVCELDSSTQKGKTPNVIALHLERRDGSAMTVRFPFEQTGNGLVSYIEGKVSIENTTPLLFVQPIQ